MRNSRFIIASFGLFMACMLAPLAHAADLTLYVSPDGKDTWSGQLAKPNAGGTDGPVATLERARDILRQKRPSGEGGARVIVADGHYILTGPFTLDARDSGVTYEAAPGAQPILSGGRIIRGFEQVGNDLWQARVPQEWRFEQLYVNGQRAVRARTPNKFYFYMGETKEVPVEGKPGQFVRTTSMPAEALAPLKGLSEAEINNHRLSRWYEEGP